MDGQVLVALQAVADARDVPRREDEHKRVGLSEETYYSKYQQKLGQQKDETWDPDDEQELDMHYDVLLMEDTICWEVSETQKRRGKSEMHWAGEHTFWSENRVQSSSAMEQQSLYIGSFVGLCDPKSLHRMHATLEDDTPSVGVAPVETVAETAQDPKHAQAKMKMGLYQEAEGSGTPY